MNAARQPSCRHVEIPQFDLAENILVEQRRLNAKRRKGPGRCDEGQVGPADVAPKTSAATWPQDVQALHHVVADIVARDIERLCRPPNGRS
jgi:hypothetical protein